MKILKTLLLWAMIYVVLFVSTFLITFILEIIGISTESNLLTGIYYVSFIAYSIWTMGFFASKVNYRFRDTFFQFIPIYGFIWQFRILFRTIERWSKNQNN
jgi:hypothetical protein